MNYPDNFTGTNMDVRSSHESEMADWDLEKIVDLKKQLRDFFWHVKRGFPKLDTGIAQDCMQEVFDDLMHKEWHRLTEISGSVGWPSEIPPFETVSFETPVQVADKEYMSGSVA